MDAAATAVEAQVAHMERLERRIALHAVRRALRPELDAVERACARAVRHRRLVDLLGNTHPRRRKVLAVRTPRRVEIHLRV